MGITRAQTQWRATALLWALCPCGGGRPTESGRGRGIVDPVEHRDRPAPGEDEDGGLLHRGRQHTHLLSVGDEKGGGGRAFSYQRERVGGFGYRGSHRLVLLRLDDERCERGEGSRLELAVEVRDTVDHLAVLREGGGVLSVLVEDGDSGDNMTLFVLVHPS